MLAIAQVLGRKMSATNKSVQRDAIFKVPLKYLLLHSIFVLFFKDFQMWHVITVAFSVPQLISFIYFRVSEEDGYNYHQIRDEELKVQGSEATHTWSGSWMRTICNFYWGCTICQAVCSQGYACIISFYPSKYTTR